MDVAVVGGGVVGLSVAEALARRGAEVVVLDAGAFGAGASAGNAGWVTPALTAPVPAPGTMRQAARWALDPASPLLVRPSLRPDFLRWSLRFWRSTSDAGYAAGMTALTALATRILDDYDRLEDLGVAFEHHRDGLLCVGRSAHAVAEELATLRETAGCGYAGAIEPLSRDEVLAQEPALQASAVAGGIRLPAERHVRPESLVRGLAAHLRGRGVALHEGARVDRLEAVRGRWRVHLPGAGPLDVDNVVVATGWESAALLAPHGVRLPMQGGKGYSVTVPAPSLVPRSPIYLLEDKVAVSPYEGGLRLAGTMELGSRSSDLNDRRVGAIEAAGERALGDWSAAGAQRWAGFRPMLPDGLPAIGPVPGRPGLHVATGHAMLGVTLGPTTGEVLAPTVLDGRPSLELAPFSPARFGNRAVPLRRRRRGAVRGGGADRPAAAAR
ncbi:NAD(P)/FAD-dependent oxidoreductase [Patulibacter americanus]|uniref:NAD(P)/FAD-dependent oxidoreductase n=1 Tax=Patulibacter americanus TaxID=588672 RepID=UPI0003B417F1|nr:FAD-dependent oxidoreductase [Patulibacter americanus]